MLTGLSAFPLTPMNEDRIDEAAFSVLIERLVAAGVNSIGALGSTGNYAYLTRQERARITQLAVAHAAHIPVIVSIGALRTRDVLDLAEDAQKAGAKGVLLAPVSYQKLSADEVYALYSTVTAAISVPLIVYDNPGTTHFQFSDELHSRIAHLPNVQSIKIPALSPDPQMAKARVDQLRTCIPTHVTIGISGDASAVNGLHAGCDTWYSVIGGLFPQIALAITQAARSGNQEKALQLAAQLRPLWALFDKHGGSLRVVASAAEILEYTTHPSLPLPLSTLTGTNREQLTKLLHALQLT